MKTVPQNPLSRILHSEHSRKCGLILLYHRIATPQRDPQLLCVSPERFRQHLEVLRRNYRIVPLNDILLATARANGRIPVAITFDDGYADVVHTALPLLKAYDAAATAFVTTDRLGSTRETWWDDLERIVLATPTLPPDLRLRLGGWPFTWHLGDNTAEHDYWDVTCSETPTPRHDLYHALIAKLAKLPPTARTRWLDAIAAWAGVPLEGRPDYMAASAHDLAVAAESDICSVGAHTLSHPILSKVPRRQQTAEITGSKAILESIVKRPVDAFAYPSGRREDYTAKTVATVAAAGFKMACCNIPRPVVPDTDRLQLPRIVVRNCPPDVFEKVLSRHATTGTMHAKRHRNQ